jgi:hypothetical protein
MSTPSLPELPGVGTLPSFGTSFPPTWVVIHNGNVSDKAVADKIVSYLMSQFPPVLAVSKEVAPDADPDSMDFMVHGIIIVGGPACWWPSTSHWHLTYLLAMDPGWKNEGTEADPVWHVVRTSPALDVRDMTASLISSIAGQFPWLTVFNVAGFVDSVKAGDLFCAGERSGIWIGDTKQ